MNLSSQSVNYQKPNQGQPLVLTPWQRQVLEILREIQTKEYPLANWYLGALHTLNSCYNPDRISQAAQSLRELLEKLPRVLEESDAQSNQCDFRGMRDNIRKRFLKDKERCSGNWNGEEIDDHLANTLREIDIYLERNQSPTRRERCKAAVENIDPMASIMGSDIQEGKGASLYELWRKLESFAHHKTEPNEGDFLVCVTDLERILFNLLAPVTAQDQQEIQSILDRRLRCDEDEERMLSLISRRGANYEFFFKHASDSRWIPLLKQKDFFAKPPRVEEIGDGRVIFPFWWPILYLERVAVGDPHLVVETIINLPETDNPRILEQICKISLKVKPIELSLRLKPWVLRCLESPYLWIDYSLIAELMNRWSLASIEATNAALRLIETVVAFRRDPNAKYNQARQREELEYQKVLEKGVRPIAEKEPYRVALILIYATDSMIRLFMNQDELDKGQGEDHSELWCQRLAGSNFGGPDSRPALVHTLTFACEKVYEKSPKSVAALDKALRNQRWKVFKRLRQHLYALHPNEQTKPWIRELILERKDYAQKEHHYEFQRMIRHGCENFGTELLTQDERTPIFDAILSGPSKERFKDWIGERFTEDVFKQRQCYFHRKQFRPFAPVLFGKYATCFQKLEATEAKVQISDKDYGPNVTMSGSMSYWSPRSKEELSELRDEDILNYINDWQDCYYLKEEDDLIEINIYALSQAFQSVFKESIISDVSRRKFWLENRGRIERPIYVYAMVQAMQDHVKAKNFDQLDEWFAFCQWVLSHPDKECEDDNKQSDISRENPDWRSSRRAVGDFVGVCLDEDVNVPVSARKSLAKLLEMLCTQPDRRLDHHKPVIGDDNDQLTEAVNNTRSRALQDMVRFGFWVKGHDSKPEFSEVTSILKKRFKPDGECPLTLPEHAILGSDYGRIWGLDEAWAQVCKPYFFPQNNLPVWLEAFGAFLIFNRPSKPVFEIVRDDFIFALEHLAKLKKQKYPFRELIDALGEHLFCYYLWEFYPLTGDGSLLERYYQKTDDDRPRWASLFNHVGNSLSNSGKDLDKGLKERIIAFFDWRFKAGEPAEVSNFTFWLKAECLEAEWRLDAYSKILDISQWKAEGVLIQLEVLEGMLSDHTSKVVECFAKLTDFVPKNDMIYIRKEEAKSILKSGRNSEKESVRRDAERARENLLRAGRFDFLDIN